MVLALATETYKCKPENYIYHQAMVRFFQGCFDQEVGLLAWDSGPTTFEEAIDHKIS